MAARTDHAGKGLLDLQRRLRTLSRGATIVGPGDDRRPSVNRNLDVRTAGNDGHVRKTCTLVFAFALALAGCGNDSPSAADEEPATLSTAVSAEPAAKASKGTKIKLGDSEFGRMLFGSNDRAIYVFENDPRGQTVCYGECAQAWPPVLTRGEPRAGAGVRKALLGTVKRRNGKQQVTYAGRPLYFYAHERPGQVLCHNVKLNGGLWWVVGPAGKPRP
jgi:predicted lipoprotein with Yx(FWY)xxD motif